MFRAAVALLMAGVFVGAAGALHAQTAPQPVFEVASIKPSASGARGMSISRTPGGRFSTENVPLRFLITFAYDVRDHQVTGGPGWLATDRWDILAKPDGEIPNGPEGNEKLRAMVRALLADRFQLTLHKETREMPVYALIVGKNGPKLTASPPESKGPSIRAGSGGMTFSRTPLSMLAQQLSNSLGRTVLDETGLAGNFDFKLEYLPEQNGMFGVKEAQEHKEVVANTELPSLFTALQEQLGLKLEAKKGTVEFLVIEKAEKATEN